MIKSCVDSPDLINFRCFVCGKKLNTSRGYLTHMSRLHSILWCANCGESFSSRLERDKHISEQHVDKTCVCDVCGKTFSSNRYMRTHKTNKHNIDVNAKIAESSASNWDIDRRKRHSEIMKEMWSNNDFKERMLALDNSESHKRALSQSIKEKWADEKYRLTQTMSHKRFWGSSTNRDMMVAAFSSPESRLKRSASQILAWSDEDRRLSASETAKRHWDSMSDTDRINQVRGAFIGKKIRVSFEKSGCLVCDSIYEFAICYAMQMDPFVEAFKRPGFMIPYLDSDGKSHRYYPDFVCYGVGGEKFLVEVKSDYTITFANVHEKASRARGWCAENGYDSFVVLTDSDIWLYAMELGLSFRRLYSLGKEIRDRQFQERSNAQ